MKKYLTQALDTCKFVGIELPESREEHPMSLDDIGIEVDVDDLMSEISAKNADDLMSETSVEIDGEVENTKNRGVRKQTVLDSVGHTTLKARFAKSNALLCTTFAQLREIHGNNALADILVHYLAKRESEATFLRMVHMYKSGFVAEVFRCNLIRSFKHQLGVTDVVHLIDLQSGINFTGMVGLLKSVKGCLPKGTLPSKKEIELVRREWATEGAQQFDLQEVLDENSKNVGWDIDPMKLLTCLMVHVYSDLLVNICKPIESGPVNILVGGQNVEFEGTDPKLNVGDWITVDGTTLRVAWVLRPQLHEHAEQRDRNLYAVRASLPGSTKNQFEQTGHRETAVFQRAIALVRTDDGRKVIGTAQVVETIRIINKGLTE